MKYLIIILLLLCSTVQASESEDKLIAPVGLIGQWADVGSTIVAITQYGSVELNPIMAPLTEGPVGFFSLFVLKTGLVAYSYNTSLADCKDSISFATGIGWAAFFFNIGQIATSISQPVLIGVSILGGGGIGYWWNVSGNAEIECKQGNDFIEYLFRERKNENTYTMFHPNS